MLKKIIYILPDVFVFFVSVSCIWVKSQTWPNILTILDDYNLVPEKIYGSYEVFVWNKVMFVLLLITAVLSAIRILYRWLRLNAEEQ